MNDPHRVSVSEADAVTDERLAKAEEYIEEEEGAANKFRGPLAVLVTLVAVHKEAVNIKLENQKNAATPIPFHPGAIKYFAEKGIKVN